ncbi:hypothetical protein [Opitutus terrae]|uniref:Uncharacterized protein n=1 Tax=Opitutus terrae (strain DSM 11246 / JCM 15787 / PB90-1) TaxID=452637 RepID=B1ZUK3_OPITP|nr:hypothetical protein [Opitutus terrae]ACB74046.1 hypothetical protein Oter_0757 [Opitutus terrae PB90-1]
MPWLPLAAAHPATLEKLQKIPPAFWLKVGIAVLAVVAVVVAARMFAKANKIIVVIIAAVVFTLIGFNWIYERNEPAWATPIVAKLAEFFPSKTTHPGK